MPCCSARLLSAIASTVASRAITPLAARSSAACAYSGATCLQKAHQGALNATSRPCSMCACRVSVKFSEVSERTFAVENTFGAHSGVLPSEAGMAWGSAPSTNRTTARTRARSRSIYRYRSRTQSTLSHFSSHTHTQSFINAHTHSIRTVEVWISSKGTRSISECKGLLLSCLWHALLAEALVQAQMEQRE